jgi:hypothetical protein
MLEIEILVAIRNAEDGKRLNGIVDEFRHGRDIGDLRELLYSRSPEVLSVGAWMLSELHFELYNSWSFLARLRELLDHEDARVRFHAFGAIYPSLADNPGTRALLQRLQKDPNDGVRKSAEAASNRLLIP